MSGENIQSNRQSYRQIQRMMQAVFGIEISELRLTVSNRELINALIRANHHHQPALMQP